MIFRTSVYGLACSVLLIGCGGGGGSASTNTDGGAPAGPPPGTTVVVPPAVAFNARANDVVWDSRRQVLYLSLPSAAGPSGNAIVAMDPTTNTVVRRQFAGSEPNVLSLSDDGQYLYAAIDGNATVQRFKLPELIPDLAIPLGRDDFYGALRAVDVAAVPGSPRSIVVGLSGRGEPSSVRRAVIFDDAVARVQTANCRCSSFQWAAEGQLYAGNNEDTGFNFYGLQADAAGLRLINSVDDAFLRFGSRIHYSADTKLLYADDGTVFDPVAGKKVATTSLRGAMVPDTTRNRLFYATSQGTAAIEALDATTYQPVGSRVTYQQFTGYPAHLVRWGSQGLALTTNDGPVMLFGGGGVSRFSTVIPEGTSRRSVIPGTVNHVVWNARSARLYATMSGASTNLANHVVVINPTTAQITASADVGSEPDAIAVSDDGAYLYVGLDELGTVQRLHLPDLTPDLTLPLGGHARYGAYIAGAIAVVPGNARSVAISRFSPGVVPAEQGGIVIFDDATSRPVTATPATSPQARFGDLVWNADASNLYSSSLNAGDLYALDVDLSGVRLARIFGGAFLGPGHLHRGVGNGLLYHDSGVAVDPSTSLPIGQYRPGDNIGGEFIASNAASNRVFTAASVSVVPGALPAYRIDAYDMTTFTPIARYVGDTASGFPFDFTEAGQGAFAFRSVEGLTVVRVP